MLMHISRWFLGLTLLGLSSTAALADGIDPVAKLQGGTGSTDLLTPNFAFDVFGGSSPQSFDYINSTGQTAVGMNLLITLLPLTPSLTFICDPSNTYFTNCNPQSPGTTLSQGGTLLISFFGLDTETGHNGIPNDPNPACEGILFCSPSVPAADFIIIFENAPGTTDLSGLPPTQGF